MIHKRKRPHPFYRPSWTARLRQFAARFFPWRRARHARRRQVRYHSRWREIFGRLIEIVLAPFHFVRFVLTRTAQAFLYSWRNARLRTLWSGLPFALTVGGSIFLAITCNARNRPFDLTHQYRDAARRAMVSQDFETAELYYERLIGLPGGSDKDALFNIAWAANALDKQERVDAILKQLAPLDRPRHAPAHVWQAQRIADKGELTRHEIQQVNTHLLYAVRLDPNNIQAHALLGAYYMNTQRFQLAEEHLTIAVRERQDLLLPLAKAHALQRHVAQAAHYGGRAVEFLRRQLAEDPRNVGVRLDCADALLFMQDFDESVAVLREELEFSDETALRQALARVYVTWSDSIRGNTIEGKRQRLRLLEAGISCNQNDEMLFDRMMAILWQKDSVADTARQLLVANIARGEATKLSHLLLGTYEGERGDFDKAIKHLEQAYNLDSSMPIVANNLAWYMLQSETIDQDKAYQLVSALAARWPTMAAIHDTRGQILARMGRWQEAAAELEKGLAQMKGNTATHQALAQVYEQLGMDELADEHRTLAGASDE